MQISRMFLVAFVFGLSASAAPTVLDHQNTTAISGNSTVPAAVQQANKTEGEPLKKIVKRPTMDFGFDNGYLKGPGSTKNPVDAISGLKARVKKNWETINVARKAVEAGIDSTTATAISSSISFSFQRVATNILETTVDVGGVLLSPQSDFANYNVKDAASKVAELAEAEAKLYDDVAHQILKTLRLVAGEFAPFARADKKAAIATAKSVAQATKLSVKPFDLFVEHLDVKGASPPAFGEIKKMVKGLEALDKAVTAVAAASKIMD